MHPGACSPDALDSFIAICDEEAVLRRIVEILGRPSDAPDEKKLGIEYLVNGHVWKSLWYVSDSRRSFHGGIHMEYRVRNANESDARKSIVALRWAHEVWQAARKECPPHFTQTPCNVFGM